ncbi:hypothetical protein P7C73_g1149, partial [Tremellales sp. Uapishka_1]
MSPDPRLPVVYGDDRRYPGPVPHPAPVYIKGIPDQEELEAFPRMFTWGEFKEMLYTYNLDPMRRNREMQKRYEAWFRGIKAEYGSTEAYLTNARLPWGPNPGPATITPAMSSPASGLVSPVSGTSTPASVGFVSLSSLQGVNGRLREKKSRSPSDAIDVDEKEEEHEYLQFDPRSGLDDSKYAVLPNDWPYCVPYGVRHYVVWSKVPIAHPVLVDFDPSKWQQIEDQGLCGFSGVVPYHPASPTQLALSLI